MSSSMLLPESPADQIEKVLKNTETVGQTVHDQSVSMQPISIASITGTINFLESVSQNLDHSAEQYNALQTANENDASVSTSETKATELDFSAIINNIKANTASTGADEASHKANALRDVESIEMSVTEMIARLQFSTEEIEIRTQATVEQDMKNAGAVALDQEAKLAALAKPLVDTPKMI